MSLPNVPEADWVRAFVSDSSLVMNSAGRKEGEPETATLATGVSHNPFPENPISIGLTIVCAEKQYRSNSARASSPGDSLNLPNRSEEHEVVRRPGFVFGFHPSRDSWQTVFPLSGGGLGSPTAI